MNSQIKTCQSLRYSWGLDEFAPEASLWIINVVLVFVASRYLFGMNSLAIFWGWDPTSWPAFLGERHRFSDILFGLGSDPIIGLGNIAYPVNQNWLPSIVLSQDQSGAVDGPLAFVIAATELFAATVLCGRLNGFAIGPSIAAGWLITMTTWQLFGLADDRHHMVLLSRPCRGARCFDCHGEHDISSRQVALGPARGRHHFSSDTRGSDVVRYDSADFLGSAG